MEAASHANNPLVDKKEVLVPFPEKAREDYFLKQNEVQSIVRN